MNLGMIIVNQSIQTMQNYAIWIQIVLLFILKLKIFIKVLLIILKNDFDTSNYSTENKRPLPRGMNNRVIGVIKTELGGKIIIEFVTLSPKAYS